MIGWIYATLRNRLGMPSFVSTLSGLLALLGLQLYLLGSTGSINLPYGLGAGELRPALHHAGLALVSCWRVVPGALVILIFGSCGRRRSGASGQPVGPGLAGPA